MKNIILILLFLSVNCFAVSSGTFTVAETGGNYTSIVSAEAGLQGNLIAPVTIYIQGSWTNPDYVGFGCTINGWTTYTTAYLLITATGTARHRGVWDNTKYRIINKSGTQGEPFLIDNYEENVRIDGLQLTFETTGTVTYAIRGDGSLGTNKNFQLSNCILKANPVHSDVRDVALIHAFTTNSSFKIWNNIFYGWTETINTGFGTGNTTYYFYNNTIGTATVFGIYNASSDTGWQLRMKNNIITKNTQGYFFEGGLPIRISTDSNVSGYATSPNINYRNQTPSFISSTTDFHLLSSDTTAYKRGVSVTAEFPERTTDIDGDIIVNNSIGADDGVVTAVSTARRRVRKTLQLE